MAQSSDMNRRHFLTTAAAGAALGAVAPYGAAQAREGASMTKRPNLVFVFGDQWRQQATGYEGDPNAITPNLDRLAGESLNFSHAVSGCPVCTPWRASFLTGQYWLTCRMFMNDICLPDEATSIAEAYNEASYDTAYIGKWHLDGHGRSAFIPRERRQGFQFWKVLECTHDYNNSFYYADGPEKLKWEGYDAIAQTREAQRYIREHPKDKPFSLVLSWGPPHAPYLTAPPEYRAMYDPAKLTLRPNVPAELEDEARRELAGYYAHITALDDCVGELLDTLDKEGLAEDTIFVFTSDHGDMLRSQGMTKKQKPWDESIMVPFLLRYPAKLGREGRTVSTILNTPDIMPTLLGLSGVPIPGSVEGTNFAQGLIDGRDPEVEAALLMCPQPFGQWLRSDGGVEFRGVRTARYTYARTLEGPWLLYDNEADPYQMTNRIDDPALAETQAHLDACLSRLLRETNDAFLSGPELLAQYGITVDETGTVPYAP